MSRDDRRDAEPDSRARTHLASERTFLAWLRTGVTLVALGLAAAQFLAREVAPGIPLTRALAIGLVFLGVFLGLVGARRYALMYRRIEEGTFRPAFRSVIVAEIMLIVVGILAVAFILLLQR